MSSPTGASVTYAAPATLASPIQVTLTAQIGGTTNSKIVNITVNPAPVISGNTPSGTVANPYTATLTVAGGTSPLKQWSLASGTLPAGLSLNPATGVISGTPTTVGSSTFAVQITDSSDVPNTVMATRTIQITSGAGSLAIAGNPPAGTVGTVYSSSLTASGGTSPYTFSLTGGALPAGLTLAGTGAISGTPTAAGTATFTAQVQDGAGHIATGSFSIVIASGSGGGLTFTIAPPTATIGTPYTGTVGITGGTGPYTCVITNLPAGLTASGCTITGTPTGPAGLTNVNVTGTDSSPTPITTSGTAPLTINTGGGGGGLTFTIAPPTATIGTPYTGAVTPTGGTGPYTCVVTNLPAGLTASGCAITGTPTGPAGLTNVTVTGTDSSPTPVTTSGTAPLTINSGGGGGGGPLTFMVAPLTGTVGTPYTGSVMVAGGTSPYTCSAITNLPAGLTASGCSISGTPTGPAATTNINVTATDGSTPTPITTSGTAPLTINAGAPTLTLGTLPGGTVGVNYGSPTLAVTGGTAPYTCTITNLPAGLTASNCTVTGTPTTAGTTSVNVTATDAGTPQGTTTGTVQVVIAPPPVTIVLGTLPNGTVNIAYSSTLPVTGGTGPYMCTITGLPAGLTSAANSCVITGTPATSGTTNVNVTATDSTSPTAATHTGTVPLTISPSATVLTFSVSPLTGTIGTPYTGAVTVAGGTTPYTCTAITNLPAGLTASGCAITGTPTGPAGTTSINVTATDSSTPTPITTTGTAPLTIDAAAPTLTLGTLPGGTVGTIYNSPLAVTGGTSPYTCTITNLPAGLTASNCVVSGTPTTAGTVAVNVTAHDAGTPQGTVTGTVSLVIAPAPVTLVFGSLPNGTVNAPYSQTLAVTGGTGPYMCTITGLPAGLTSAANSCVITGTPTTAGTVSVNVTATDSTTPTAGTKTGPVSLTIDPPVGSLTLAAPPNGTINVVYTGSVGVTGGTGPYTCTITGLPSGLSSAANSCAITGTPTSAGTTTIHVMATDASTPTALTTTGDLPLVINAAPAMLTLVGPATTGTVGTAYSSSVLVSGGVSAYTCTITNLPAGLTASNCSISGNPTTAGSTTINVSATDSTTPTALTKTGTFPITISNAVVLSIGSPAAGMVGTPYAGAVGVSGGTPTYTCTITGLPAGLTSNSCSITGTPTVAGTSTLSVTATDSSTPTPVTTTGPATLVINPPPTLALTGTLPNAVVGTPYSQTVQATGGIAPYSYSVTTGSLPAGLSLATDGTITGTPTTVGASSFTITATDTEATPQTATNNYVLLVTYPTGPNNGELVGPYAFLFRGYDDLLVGLINYQTASIGSFTADGLGVLSAGKLDTNHQIGGSSTHAFLGSYEIGADNRGLMAITSLNADGTTGVTTIYSLSVKAPVSPATVATQAQIIEYDGNIIVSSRGSGQILQQTATSFAAGLSGPYAFGLSGDTGCGLSCSVGLSGPVASVGTFTASSNALSNGQSDANIGTTNYPSEGLTGTYGSADGNGRVALTMSTTGTPAGFYPTGYVAYMVNANQSFVMSTDSHATYALLAGTAQSQTISPFDSTSFSGPIIGYENSQANPGLLGVALKDVLNVSTSTVFRTVASPGSCKTSNVDSGGVSTVLGDVTGTVGALLGSTVVNALLGTYQSLGTSTCTITSNGRGVYAYPPPSSALAIILIGLGLDNPPSPRTFYLTGPGKGYFLETGYAALGYLEPQTGSPYTLANFNGTFVYGSLPPATAVGINSNGVLTADGAGNVTSTLDTNVSAGSLNLLTLGTPGSGTYTYSPNLAPLDFTNPATVGRYVYGTNVIYEISPGRFVLVDTNPLTTSPTVTLLY
ncbi:MAG: putative Ig domain-containing protein [Granulicella sp.]